MSPYFPVTSLPSWTGACAVGAGVIAVLAYGNAIGADFQFDDFNDVVGNPSAEAATFFERLPFTVRPLVKASYALQDLVHGPWAAGFLTVNVALHVGTAMLAGLLIARGARFAGLADRPAALFALCVTAVWAVHPALSETVTALSGRSVGLSMLLMLGALLAASGPPTTATRLAGFGLAALAPLARETAMILPALLIAWQATLQPREPLRQSLLRLAPIALGTLLGAVLVFALPRHQALVAYSLTQRPPLLALRNNIHAAREILGFWFRPDLVTIDPAPPLFWPWTAPETLATLALFAAMGLAAIVLRRRAPLTAFGLALTLLALLPSNSILWRIDPVSLRPLALAGLGMTLAAAGALLPVLRHLPHPATAAAVGALVLALGSASVTRNLLYWDEVALWEDAIAKTPDQARPWIMLGFAHLARGNWREAETALNEGLERDPFNAQAQLALDTAMRLREAGAPPLPMR